MTSFFWDGRENDLKEVVVQPFTNPQEMGLAGVPELLKRIAAQPTYRSRFAKAFGSDEINKERIGTALATYLQSLPVIPSRFDRHARTGSDMSLSENERAGLELFRGKAACTDCHVLSGTPAAFTDNLYHHTGVGFERIAGNINHLVSRLDALAAQNRPLGEAILADADVAELGRFAVTRQPQELGAFRTPSLRNVAQTAPYMHDGSIPTLSAAVEREIYYRSLARGRPISLTVDEQRQLVAFLHTLTATDPAVLP